MRTAIVLLLLAASACVGADRPDDVSDLYDRLEVAANAAASAADPRHDKAFRAAKAAWDFLAATEGPPEQRRFALSVHADACEHLASVVDWSKAEARVAGTRIPLVRRGFLAQPVSEVVPAALQPTQDFGKLVTTDGVGGAVFVVLPESEKRAKDWPYLPPIDFAYAATALLRFDGEAPRFELLDPLERAEVEVFGAKHPLRANFTAPFARMAKGIDPGEVANEGLKTPRLDLEALYLLEPPRDDKIPILFVHGLKSSPRAWREMALALRADERIRRNYQFVAYQYPTGYAISLLNARLRQVLEEFWVWFDTQAPRARQRGYVAVGHSMGGLQIRSLAVSSGQRLWDRTFTKPRTEIDLEGRVGAFVKRMVFFEPDPKLARLIFLATPHRGSPLATGPVGAIGSSMVEEDPLVHDFRTRLLKRYGKLLREGVRRRIAEPRTSIDHLDPESLYLRALGELPLRVGLPFHSIIGDLRGDTENPTGDGVVPYASAHLEGAKSELIVKSGHGVQTTPEAIAEVKRILFLHLEQSNEGR